ncbi:LLM class flavin-dependent oxidoreductase [Nostoc sp. ChiQUE01b]|uniref:LLM class flavin-dependent oxidoreductase n=1 Tax=Nostoc sp. ChiQUE01b TaxID=3075376 RepID=UPI002AD41E9B|nr:LLM class flavin-dependent oxidoreductase [Nostoc sp. ChiQUE01b]MDZ8261922.1 LLM class flavin-dependent oxidoreductase [Nostoc sp. ChiQUE01b]
MNDYKDSMQNSLKLGFFIQPVHPPSRSYGDVLGEDREAVVLADRLGYREAFIGEHLVDSAETITSSLAFIANLADACPSITFGTGVLPLANYHPAMVAAQVAMVDHLVQGRLILGVGPGVAGDAEAIGDLGSDRNRKTQEALEHMCRIWSEEPPYRIEGKFYRTTTERSLDRNIGVGVAVRPLQEPHPPIAITSIRPDAQGPHAAGARGWSGISATYVGAHVIRAHIKNYLEGRRSAGLCADASGWRVARSVFVADDETTAHRYVHREDGAHDFYFHVMRTKLAKASALDVMRDFPDQPDSELSTKRCIERLVIAGTPQSVADQILAFRNEVGAFGTLLYTGHDWTDPALARRSMELMANEVWPRIDRAAHGTTPKGQTDG